MFELWNGEITEKAGESPLFYFAFSAYCIEVAFEHRIEVTFGHRIEVVFEHRIEVVFEHRIEVAFEHRIEVAFEHRIEVAFEHRIEVAFEHRIEVVLSIALKSRLSTALKSHLGIRARLRIEKPLLKEALGLKLRSALAIFGFSYWRKYSLKLGRRRCARN